MITTLIYSLVAGVIGTLTGGIISIFFGHRTEKCRSYLLAFAGGFMLALVCFDLIPESVEAGGMTASVSGIIFGIVLVMLFEFIAELCSSKLRKNQYINKYNVQSLTMKNKCSDSSVKGKEISAKMISEKQSDCEKASKSAMFKMGVVMTFAIAVHNFPEGLAIGAVTAVDNGLLISILICVHNIPEGMAMSTPMVSSGVKNYKILIYAALTGLPTVIGALIGYLAGGASQTLVSLCLSAAAGFMLYIVFCEMLPSAISMQENNKVLPLIFIISLILGILFIGLF